MGVLVSEMKNPSAGIHAEGFGDNRKKLVYLFKI